jgi:hypothetical protein
MKQFDSAAHYVAAHTAHRKVRAYVVMFDRDKTPVEVEGGRFPITHCDRAYDALEAANKLRDRLNQEAAYD